MLILISTAIHKQRILMQCLSTSVLCCTGCQQNVCVAWNEENLCTTWRQYTFYWVVSMRLQETVIVNGLCLTASNKLSWFYATLCSYFCDLCFVSWNIK